MCSSLYWYLLLLEKLFVHREEDHLIPSFWDCWKAPWENFGISYNFWSLVAFLNCCSFLKIFSQFCHLCFIDIYLDGFVTVFFIFIPLQWHHYWTKLKRNEKLEKNISKKRWSDETFVWVSKYSKGSPSKTTEYFHSSWTVEEHLY